MFAYRTDVSSQLLFHLTSLNRWFKFFFKLNTCCNRRLYSNLLFKYSYFKNSLIGSYSVKEYLSWRSTIMKSKQKHDFRRSQKYHIHSLAVNGDTIIFLSLATSRKYSMYNNKTIDHLFLRLKLFIYLFVYALLYIYTLASLEWSQRCALRNLIQISVENSV